MKNLEDIWNNVNPQSVVAYAHALLQLWLLVKSKEFWDNSCDDLDASSISRNGFRIEGIVHVVCEEHYVLLDFYPNIIYV